MRVLSWLLWLVAPVTGLASLVSSLSEGRTPTTQTLIGVTVLALVTGVAVDVRRMAGAR